MILLHIFEEFFFILLLNEMFSFYLIFNSYFLCLDGSSDILKFIFLLIIQFISI